eukprot:gb/GFBE01024635.1/.p1 GENE.gb/GFBE01024635.1/~~gb/GFBE01024635.1/.p1  ORF type:complete len:671 (+),score=126.21 gb/GFBE01024635.1/:1-2013(+)
MEAPLSGPSGNRSSGSCCGGCFEFLRGKKSPQRRFGSSVADRSPRSWGIAREVDEVPSRERPRVGSWASPVPYLPAAWGTWQRQNSEDSMCPLHSPEPDFQTKFELHVQESTSTSLDQSHQIGHGIASAQPQRLGEIGIVPRSQARPNAPASPPAGRGFMIEQLLQSPGSLPQGLSHAERARQFDKRIDKVLAELPPRASTCERVAKTPRRLLTARGPSGQRLRRGIIKGAKIVFFTTGYEGKRFIYEKAKALGVRSILIDSADSWSRVLVDEGVAERFIALDMSQTSESVFRQALSAIEALESDPKIGKVDGVATFAELSVPVAARLAEALGLPGPSPESADCARDKHATRAALKATGLPTPPNCEITCEADLARAMRVVGFPAVLKPVSGAASVGVKKVESEAELRSAYLERDRELRSLVISSGAIVKDDGNQGATVGAENVIGARFLLESYLDGDEVDVDIVMSEGEWQYAAVSDNGPTLEPYFNETWAVSPSLLPRTKQVELKELAISSVKALGFEDGIFHVECKSTTQNGPQLIEVNARMGGGPVYATNLRTWGVDLVEETLFCSAGIPARPAASREPHECIANADVNTLQSGRLKDLSFLEPLKGRAGVISFNNHVTEGEEVVGPADGLPTWLVEIVVSKPTPKEALDFLLSLEAEVQAKVRLA